MLCCVVGCVWLCGYDRWARASYLRRLVRPVVTSRRHYYEDWVCRVNEHPEQPQAMDEAGVASFAADTLSLCKTNTNLTMGLTYAPPDIHADACW